MPRPAWLALISLISLGVLFTLRSYIGARPMRGETASPSAVSDIDDRSPLAKSDRLPSAYFDKSVAKTADTIVPAVPEAASNPKQADDLVPQSKSDASEVTTWHWHLGSKVTKRTTVVEPR